jgi:hypothetical protein
MMRFVCQGMRTKRATEDCNILTGDYSVHMFLYCLYSAVYIYIRRKQFSTKNCEEVLIVNLNLHLHVLQADDDLQEYSLWNVFGDASSWVVTEIVNSFIIFRYSYGSVKFKRPRLLLPRNKPSEIYYFQNFQKCCLCYLH